MANVRKDLNLEILANVKTSPNKKPKKNEIIEKESVTLMPSKIKGMEGRTSVNFIALQLWWPQG